MPCTSPVTVTRGRHKQRKPVNDQAKAVAQSNFNLTGTSEFMDRTDKIISDSTELEEMQKFIMKKIYQMESKGNEKQSEVSCSCINCWLPV